MVVHQALSVGAAAGWSVAEQQPVCVKPLARAMSRS
jgi:hypothetical protein